MPGKAGLFSILQIAASQMSRLSSGWFGGPDLQQLTKLSY
jgi:hypothetical protein